MESFRTCNKCGLTAKTEDELKLFVTDKKAPHGRATECKECRKEYSASSKVRERSKAIYREQIEEKREDVNAQARENHRKRIEKALNDPSILLKRCTCGCTAYVESELVKFTTRTTSMYGVTNTCKECTNQKALEKKLVGNANNLTKYHNLTQEEKVERNRKAMSNEKLKYGEEEIRKRNYLRHIKRTFGLTEETFLALKENQNNCCAICNTSFDERKPCVDHNHDTGEVRGLLCNACNTSLGTLNDSIEVLKNAINYLETNGSYGSH